MAWETVLGTEETGLGVERRHACGCSEVAVISRQMSQVSFKSEAREKEVAEGQMSTLMRGTGRGRVEGLWCEGMALGREV